MADIWNRVVTLGGVISAENVRVTFGTNNGGLLVQQARIEGARQIGQIMDLKDGKIYLITRIPELFRVTLVGIVTNPADYKTFLSTYGSACGTHADLTITVTPGLCTTISPGTITYTVSNPILMSISDTVAAEQYIYVGVCILSSQSISVN